MRPVRVTRRCTPKRCRLWLWVTAAALLGCALAPGAAAGEPKKKPAQAPDNKRLVWPPPPQPARIIFLKEITAEDDVLGRRKHGWMDIAAGKKRQVSRARLEKPYGVAADSRGRLYVADGANRRVVVFDLDRREVEYRGTQTPAKLALPIGVAVDDRDRLFVSDSFLHRVTCFDPEGDVLGIFGADELQRTGGLALDSQRRRVYVADPKAHRIAVFDADSFQFLRYIGERSSPEREPGKFLSPTNVAVDAQGFLYVTDTWNHRVQVLDAEGKFVRAFGEQGTAPGMFLRPKGIAVDRDGHIYVADSEFNNIQVFTPEGRLLLVLGDIGAGPGQFTLIAGLAVDRHDRLLATDQWRGRVQLFRYVTDAEAAAGKGAR